MGLTLCNQLFLHPETTPRKPFLAFKIAGLGLVEKIFYHLKWSNNPAFLLCGFHSGKIAQPTLISQKTLSFGQKCFDVMFFELWLQIFFTIFEFYKIAKSDQKIDDQTFFCTLPLKLRNIYLAWIFWDIVDIVGPPVLSVYGGWCWWARSCATQIRLLQLRFYSIRAASVPLKHRNARRLCTAAMQVVCNLVLQMLWIWNISV